MKKKLGHTITKTSVLKCRVDNETRPFIKDLFKYDKTYWKRVVGQKRKEATLKDQFMISGHDRSGGQFWRGSLPRVVDYLKSLGHNVSVKSMKGVYESFPIEKKASLPGIEFRRDQKKAIASTKTNYFGRITAPTRSGKTIVQLGIASQFPNACILLLAHTKDLVTQLGDEALLYRQNLPTVYTPKNVKDIKRDLAFMEEQESGLMVCTIQSLARVDPELYAHIYDIVMVDEAHHVNKELSMYGKVLTSIVAPRRYGFTATLPTQKDQELFNEGMLGPVIAELTVSDAMDKGIIAKPRVELHPVPYEKQVNVACYSYKDYYQLGIVENQTRNKIIANRVKLSLAFNKPTLIIVERVEHGNQIRKYLRRFLKIRVPFVKGSTHDSMREARLRRIKSGQELVTICSRIWMEGITMQNLEVIIYAAGMKEKKRVLQAMGRGLGVTEDKNRVTLIDFLDPYRHLAEHSIARTHTYIDEGWIKWT